MSSQRNFGVEIVTKNSETNFQYKMKCPGNLTYLILKIDTVKKYSSGADPEIFAGKGSAQYMIFW